MKFLAIILSLFILMLSAIPCMEASTDNALQKTELTPETTTDHNHNDVDFCTPFCVCHCCVSPITVTGISIRFGFSSFPQKHITEFSSGYVYSLFASIWQPPQLG